MRRVMGARTAIVGGLVLALLQAAPASAGIDPLPPKTDIGGFACRDLLALQPALQERALIYLAGVSDGRRRAAVFDAEATGGAVERVLAACRSTPSLTVIDAFVLAWR